MKYLLDTNACIVSLKNQDSGIRKKLETISINKVVVFLVVKAELFSVAKKSLKVAENLVK